MSSDILILCLYMDDLIITSHKLKMIVEVKEVMINQFEIIDIGLMFHLQAVKCIL